MQNQLKQVCKLLLRYFPNDVRGPIILVEKESEQRTNSKTQVISVLIITFLMPVQYFKKCLHLKTENKAACWN